MFLLQVRDLPDEDPIHGTLLVKQLLNMGVDRCRWLWRFRHVSGQGCYVLSRLRLQVPWRC